MADDSYLNGGDPDEGPKYAYWIPDQAVSNMAMEKALHGNESNVQLAKRLIDECLPLAVMSVTHMAMNSPKEETRLAASKYLIDHAMGSPIKKDDVPVGSRHAWDVVHDAVLVDAQTVQSDWHKDDS